MAPPESCIFYDNPKCLLKGDSCDLNCNSAQNTDDGQSNEEVDKLIEWRIENNPVSEGNLELKPG